MMTNRTLTEFRRRCFSRQKFRRRCLCRAKAAIRLENRQALGLPFLKALFAISRWSGLKRA